MRNLIVLATIVILALSVSSVTAASSWILPIHQMNGGGWTELPGAGYGGSSAWSASGPDGVRRICWAMNAPEMPTVAALYSIEFFAPTAGPGNWQPIESLFNGAGGETWPMEPGIPWAGQYGTNHQYLGTEFSDSLRGTWVSAGPGPQAPEGDTFDAGGSGIYMWLKQGSWLYAKWDFGWPIDRSWSAIRVTAVTPVPEPGSLGALAGGLLGMAGFALRRRGHRIS